MQAPMSIGIACNEREPACAWFECSDKIGVGTSKTDMPAFFLPRPSFSARVVDEFVPGVRTFIVCVDPD